MVGIIGGIIGILGGILGTALAIVSTQGPKERAFVVKVAAIVWLVVSLYVGLLWITPSPYRWLLVGVYIVGMLIGVRKLRKKHTEIRRLESGESDFKSHL